MVNRIRKAADGLRWRQNIYVVLAWSLFVMMILFMVCRVGFYLFNQEFFPGMTLSRFALIALGGLRFDLSAILYLNSLFVLLMIIPFKFRFEAYYQQILKYLFIVINAIGLGVNLADTVYYRYTLRRTTLSVFRQFENEQNWFGLITRFLIDYWYVIIGWGLLVWVMTFLFSRMRASGPQLKNDGVFYTVGFVGMLIISGLVVAGVRGGFGESTRPITLSNAAQYATVPKDINLVLNTPFAVLRTARTPIVEKVNYFSSDTEAEKVFSPIHTPRDTSMGFVPKNVVVIILESFSKEFFGSYHTQSSNAQYQGYTPFLDSLIDHSMAYQYSFANGRKSIDAMPSVICSIPALEVPFVLSHYSGNKVNSLSSLLKEKGYYSAFFHGAPNGSMGFQAYANACGFDDYFGKDEYGNDNDFDGIWGIWDEKFLRYYADKMNTFKEPFYTNFFSVSSHHPYRLPKEFVNEFGDGELSIYKTIGYTDYALRKFFKQVSSMPWYENTLFVITADHASAQIRLEEYNTAWGYFSVPIFFFEPGSGHRLMEPSIVQQIDIMPTILGWLHYDKPYVAFGRDLLKEDALPVAFNYLDGMYQSFAGNYLLQFDGTKSMGLYDFRNDRLLLKNLVSELPDTVQRMEFRLKAFIQQYNSRMVDDNLTIAGSQVPRP